MNDTIIGMDQGQPGMLVLSEPTHVTIDVSGLRPGETVLFDPKPDQVISIVGGDVGGSMVGCRRLGITRL